MIYQMWYTGINYYKLAVEIWEKSWLYFYDHINQARE
jgi:hypothetical protein